MTPDTTTVTKPPRGVYVISLLLFLSGGLLLLAALILPLTGANLVGNSVVPWYFYVLYGGYFLAVGWGLWGGRRWAYVAALLMCVVLGFYQVQNAVVLGRNALFQVIALAAIFVYLLQPGVRASFLRPGEPRQDDKATR
jgi:hypothetical protein